MPGGDTGLNGSDIGVRIVGGRKTVSLRQRQGVAASLALATLLMALPAREAATADSRALGDHNATLDRPAHRPAASPVVTAVTTSHSPARPKIVPTKSNVPSLASLAFVQFCIHYPLECMVSGAKADKGGLTLTQARLTDLLDVNRAVNRLIEPRANVDVLHGEWNIAPEQGNCKDYAVTKRHELLARGWPSGALLLAEVVLASGEHHLVLVVRMREADLILDNLQSEIGTVAQSTYRWIRMQKQDNPNYWLAFDAAHPRPMAANAF